MRVRFSSSAPRGLRRMIAKSSPGAPCSHDGPSSQTSALGARSRDVCRPRCVGLIRRHGLDNLRPQPHDTNQGIDQPLRRPLRLDRLGSSRQATRLLLEHRQDIRQRLRSRRGSRRLDASRDLAKPHQATQKRFACTRVPLDDDELLQASPHDVRVCVEQPLQFRSSIRQNPAELPTHPGDRAECRYSAERMCSARRAICSSFRL